MTCYLLAPEEVRQVVFAPHRAVASAVRWCNLLQDHQSCDFRSPPMRMFAENNSYRDCSNFSVEFLYFVITFSPTSRLFGMVLAVLHPLPTASLTSTTLIASGSLALVSEFFYLASAGLRLISIYFSHAPVTCQPRMSCRIYQHEFQISARFVRER